MTKTDVVVIGGGIIGCSIAYNLSKKGKKVILIDRKGIGEETSSACDGGVNLQTKAPGISLKLARRSLQLYEGLAKELDYDIHFEKQGGLVLVDNAELLKLTEQNVKHQLEGGVDVTLVSGDEARRMEPCLSREVIAAAYCPDDSRVSPIRTTIAYATAAVRNGAELRLNTPVTGILQEKGCVVGVKTLKEDIYADQVVVACGVFSPEIGKMVGINVPIKPRKGQLVVTEQTAPCIKHNLMCARYIALKHDPSLATTSSDPFYRKGVNLFLEQTVDGNILIGSNREWAGVDKHTSYEILAAICEYSTHFVPFLKDLNIIRTFAGLRPYCEGGPILGPVDGLDGRVMACGHEGDGIAMAPVTGEIISDFVINGVVTEGIGAYLFSRFSK